MSVPKLRFKEFEGDWIETTLGEVASISSGGTPSRSNSEYWNGNIPWITTSLIGENIISTADEYITEAGLKNSAAKIFPHGTLLMAMYGQGKTRGKIGLLGIDAATNQACAAIIFKLNFSNIFFLQILRNKYIEIRNMSNVGGQDNLSASLLKQISIVYPTPSEQTKIANFLTTIDDYINQMTRKHALLTQYKKAAMQQIFSQQLRFKDENREDFSDWEDLKIKDIADVNPKTESLPEKFIYIDLESVSKGILLKEKTILKLEAPSRAQRLVTKKDILFQMVRPYQKNNLFFNKEGFYVASTGYAQLRAKKCLPDFLYHVLHLDDFIGEVMNRCTGTSYPAINSNDLADIEVSLPSLAEQTKIANFLTQLDQQLDQLQQQIDQVKQYKQGLLQQMFV